MVGLVLNLFSSKHLVSRSITLPLPGGKARKWNGIQQVTDPLNIQMRR